jgi:hypothetical protein
VKAHRTRLRLLLLALALAAAGGRLAGMESQDDNYTEDGDVRFLIESWIKAQGGWDAFAAVHSFSELYAVQTKGQETKTEINLIETPRGHFWAETVSPGAGTVVQAFDGGVGWKSHAGWGYGPMSRNEIQQWAAQAQFLNPPALLRPYKNRSLGAGDTVAGRRCYAVNMSDGNALQEMWYFDKETSQLLRIDRLASDGSVQFQVAFSDFRRTGDLTFPFLIEVTEGKAVTTIRRSRVVLNPPVDESAFVLTMDQLREMNAVSAILDRHATVSGSDRVGTIRLSSRVVRATTESSATGLKTTLLLSQKGSAGIVCRFDAPGMGETLEGYDGREGWMESEILGFHRLKPAELAHLQMQSNIVFFGNLALSHPFRKLLGERLLQGRRTDAVVLATPAGPEGVYYFDRETGRLIRAVPYKANVPGGTTVDFSDFRRAEGMEIPYVVAVANSTGRVVTRLQSIDNNVFLDDSLFEPAPIHP